MDERVPLNELNDALEDVDYPITPAEVGERCDEVTLELADGEENLGDLIAGSSQDAFASAEELADEVRNLLPRHAVGEPYQSEGEG